MTGPCEKCGATKENRCICSSVCDSQGLSIDLYGKQLDAISKALSVLTGEEIDRLDSAGAFSKWLESIVDGGGNREKCRNAIDVLRDYSSVCSDWAACFDAPSGSVVVRRWRSRESGKWMYGLIESWNGWKNDGLQSEFKKVD